MKSVLRTVLFTMSQGDTDGSITTNYESLFALSVGT